MEHFEKSVWCKRYIKIKLKIWIKKQWHYKKLWILKKNKQIDKWRYEKYNDKAEDEYIKDALENYNYYIRQYDLYVKQDKEQLKEVSLELKEPILEIRHQDINQYLQEKPSEPRFAAWSENFVFIRSVYDGWENIIAIPRNPSDDLPERAGGG